MSGSAPPLRAATAISRASFVNSWPRRASVCPFWCLICDHLEWPDISSTSKHIDQAHSTWGRMRGQSPPKADGWTAANRVGWCGLGGSRWSLSPWWRVCSSSGSNRFAATVELGGQARDGARRQLRAHARAAVAGHPLPPRAEDEAGPQDRVRPRAGRGRVGPRRGRGPRGVRGVPRRGESSSPPMRACRLRYCGRRSTRGDCLPFAGFVTGRREVVYGDSRLDLLLSGPGGACFIEVKSVTLVEDGVALFPDAPTERGRRHLGALVRAMEEGYRAAAVFVIQREDARACAPHDTADPAFGPRAPARPSPQASRPTPTSAASRGGRFGWPMRFRCCCRHDGTIFRRRIRS